MKKDRKITEKGLLLTKDGALRECGWANSHILKYNPESVSPLYKSRLKEWNRFYIIKSNGKYAVSFTVYKNVLDVTVSCSVYDFETKEKFDCTERPFTVTGKVKIPDDYGKGDILFDSENCGFHADKTADGYHIYCSYKKSFTHTDCEANIYVTVPEAESSVSAVSREDEKYSFYYGHKTLCLSAGGYVKVHGKSYEFDSSEDYAVADWGRGAWKGANTRYWGFASGLADGKPFGYSIGYFFGDTLNSSENTVYYDGKCHKMQLVDFGIPTGKIMNEWKMTSSDNRFKVHFKPFFNDRTDIGGKIYGKHGDRLFGFSSGSVTLDDGTVLEFENIPAFHEIISGKR